MSHKLDQENSSLLSDGALTPYGLEKILKEYYPHGHPQFIPNMIKKIALHSNKNHDYAVGGPPLGNFDRVAAFLSCYPNFPYATSVGVVIVYMLKQLDAFMWLLSQRHQAKTESLEARCADIVVYAGIIEAMLGDVVNGS